MFKSIKYLLFLILTCLLLLEVALRVYNPITLPIRSNQILLPINQTFTQRNTNNPKVDEFQTYRYNSVGLRGPELPAEPQRFTKIITVGGSTTACVELSDGRTWPDQLLIRLEKESDSVWLNNAGQNGHSTFGHMFLLEQHLKKLRPDLILYLVGLNDVAREDLNSYDTKMIRKNDLLKNRIIASSELISTAQVIKRSLMAYDLGVNSFFPLDIRKVSTVDIQPLEAKRELMLHKSMYLDNYKLRLEKLVERTQAAGSQPVFITQPALYGQGTDKTTGVVLDNLETSRKNLPGHLEWQVLELYNEVTRNVAADHSLLLIDLAVMMPKDSAYYFDWFHYSNAGAEKVADIVAEELLKSALIHSNNGVPFAQNSGSLSVESTQLPAGSEL